MSRELFGPEEPVVKLQSVCFEKLIFQHVFNVRKTKRIAKFVRIECRCCEDVKGIAAPEIGLISFGTFENRLLVPVEVDNVIPHGQSASFKP